MASEIAKNSNFWYKFPPKKKSRGFIEKLEYRCTSRNHPLCDGTIIVLKITLLHGVSIITNFVTPKRDKKKNKKNEQKTSHFFVYSRRVTHDPHRTWHGDRGGPYHFCTPITFLIRSVISALGAIENL